jgi:hypothetical protein
MAKRGPNTEAGKQIVSLNAVRHGLRSDAPVIPGIESEEEWAIYRDAIVDDWAPEGAMEVILANRVATLFWRLQRVVRQESNLIVVRQERVEQEHAPIAEYRGGPTSVEAAVSVVEATRAAVATLARLPRLNDDAPLHQNDAYSALLAAAGDDDALLTLPVEGLPPGEEWSNFRHWTAGALRRALVVMASHRGVALETFVDVAIARAEESEAKAERDLAELELELDRMRRSRLLPADGALHNIQRYEAHLNRQLYQAIHQLEVMQARRGGSPVPVAQVQFYGAGDN